MRRVALLLIGCLMAATAFAQRGGGGGRGGGFGHGGGFSRGGGMGHGGFSRGGGGFSNGFSRGGFVGSHSGFNNGFSRGGFSGSRGFGGFGHGFGGGFGRGFGGGFGRGFGGGFGRGFGRFGGFGRSFWYPGFSLGFAYYDYDPGFYGSPYYSPAYYGYSYPYGYAPSTSVVSDYGYRYEDSPQVVINQNYVRRDPDRSYEYDYSRAPNDATDYKPTLYLIALRDHNIRPALTYWVEGGTLYYVTEDHAMRQVPLSSVDRDLSERLNRERHMNFRLPSGQ